MFNSQGYIGTGSQDLSLAVMGLEPTGENL